MSQNSSPSSINGPRLGLLLGAGALVAYGLTRRSKSGTALAAAGGVLAYKGLNPGLPGNFQVKSRFRINATADQAYALWRDLAGLPRFMTNIKSVRVIDEKRSEWTLRGPESIPVKWTAELTNDQPGKRIAWQTTPDSMIQTTGSVSFTPDPLGRGIFVETESRLSIPSGPLARTALSIMGKHPQAIAKEDLRHFKALLETGEIPTTLAQSHGPRGVKGKLDQYMFREPTNHPGPQVKSQQPTRQTPQPEDVTLADRQPVTA